MNKILKKNDYNDDNDYNDYKRAKIYVDRIRKSNIYVNINEFQRANVEPNDLYRELMELYFQINPDWYIDYDEIELKKSKLKLGKLDSPKSQKELITIFKKDEKEQIIQAKKKNDTKTLQKIIETKQKEIIGELSYSENSDSEKILEIVLSINVANQIAHECDKIGNTIIKYFFTNKSAEITQSDMKQKINDGEFSENLCKLIRTYTLSKIEGASKYIPEVKLEEELQSTYGISKKLLDEFIYENGQDLYTLRDMKIHGFRIKDANIQRACVPSNKEEPSILEKEGYSYGIIPPDDRTNMDRLVIDVPCYGQFCVHVKSSESVSRLMKHNYPYGEARFFERSNVILVPCDSKLIQRQKDGRNITEIWEHLRGLAKSEYYQDRRLAHNVANSLGAMKEDFDNIYYEDDR